MGTPEFAVSALRAVAGACDVAAVVTRPDRPRGRGLARGPSAVADEAGRLGLPLMKPEAANAPATLERLAALAPELFAVVAFGAILSPALLAVPARGAINLHGSLLPDYRGASPVQRALWDGREETGVTTLWMDEGIDTGDIILQRRHPIAPEDDAGTLAAALAAAGAPLLAESLTLAHGGRAPRVPQDRARGSYAPRLAKEDGRVDWTLAAAVVWHRQRAVTPWPGAFATLAGRRLQILACRPAAGEADGASPGTVLGSGPEGVRVACGQGVLDLVRVRPEGRADMAAADWWRGVRLDRGARFATTKEEA